MENNTEKEDIQRGFKELQTHYEQLVSQINNPKISVVIPVYNTEKYLANCLDSILAQHFVFFEVIVVDDASLGNCRAIVQEYAQKFSRIRYIGHDTNRGLLAARITGIKEARGTYVACVDSDDTIAPTYLSHLHSIAETKKVDIVGTSPYPHNLGTSYTLWENTDIVQKLLAEELPWNICGKLIKRHLFREALESFSNDQHIIRCEDLILFSLVAKQVQSFHYEAINLYRYNLTSGSTKNKNIEQIKKDITDFCFAANFLSFFWGIHASKTLLHSLLYWLYRDKLQFLEKEEILEAFAIIKSKVSEEIFTMATIAAIQSCADLQATIEKQKLDFNRVQKEKQALLPERNKLTQEKQSLMAERNKLLQEKQRLLTEKSKLTQENQRLSQKVKMKFRHKLKREIKRIFKKRKKGA